MRTDSAQTQHCDLIGLFSPLKEGKQTYFSGCISSDRDKSITQQYIALKFFGLILKLWLPKLYIGTLFRTVCQIRISQWTAGLSVFDSFFPTITIGGAVFSVVWGPCRGIVRQSNSEASSCRSTEEYKKSLVEREWEFSQLSVAYSHEKLVAEEKLEVSLWKLIVCFNSVTRTRLVKTGSPSAYVTVNCKLCKSAIALYFL
jgi:hypothetical protein